MNFQPAKMAQPVLEVGFNTQGVVPNLDALPGREAGNGINLVPLVAIGIAASATLAWNGFLLWWFGNLVVSWLGF
jgi:hypothetical protein